MHMYTPCLGDTGCLGVILHKLEENWLVVWNMAFIFHNIWDVILPI